MTASDPTKPRTPEERRHDEMLLRRRAKLAKQDAERKRKEASK